MSVLLNSVQLQKSLASPLRLLFLRIKEPWSERVKKKKLLEASGRRLFWRYRYSSNHGK
jgi:hypothetical protein